MKESAFKEFMKTYLETKIDKRVAASFHDLDSLLAKQSEGYYRHYLKFTNGGGSDL